MTFILTTAAGMMIDDYTRDVSQSRCGALPEDLGVLGGGGAAHTRLVPAPALHLHPDMYAGFDKV